MNKKLIFIPITAFLASLASVGAFAAGTTSAFKLVAEVESIDELAYTALCAPINEGDLIEVIWSYDTTTPAYQTTDDTYAGYMFPREIFSSLRVTVNGHHSYASQDAAFNYYADVLNNQHVDQSFYFDKYTVSRTGLKLDCGTKVSAVINLWDFSAQAFASAALPVSIDLTDFPDVRKLWITDETGGYEWIVAAKIISLTPIAPR